ERSCGRPCASPWSVEGERDAALPLVAVAGADVQAGPAAHRELAADGGPVLVNRATQVQRIDGRAPAVLVLGHGFQAVVVDGDEPGGYVVARQQQDRQAAAHCIAVPAVSAGLARAQDVVPAGKGVGVRASAISAPEYRWAWRTGIRMATPWKRPLAGADAAACAGSLVRAAGGTRMDGLPDCRRSIAQIADPCRTGGGSAGNSTQNTAFHAIGRDAARRATGRIAAFPAGERHDPATFPSDRHSRPAMGPGGKGAVAGDAAPPAQPCRRGGCAGARTG